MPDQIVTVCGNIECKCGLRPVAFFKATLRQVGEEWVILVPTHQQSTCPCGQTYWPDCPEVDMPVRFSAPVGKKGRHITAPVRLLKTEGGD